MTWRMQYDTLPCYAALSHVARCTLSRHAAPRVTVSFTTESFHDLVKPPAKIFFLRGETWVVGFLLFNTPLQNFTRIVHQKFTGISPEFRQNIELECLKKGITTTQPSHRARLSNLLELLTLAHVKIGTGYGLVLFD